MLLLFHHPHQGFDLLAWKAVGFLLGAGLMDGLRDAFLIERLEQVVDRIDLEGLDRVLVVGRGEDDLGQRDFLVEQLLDDAEAVEAGHLHVEEDEVGAAVLDQADGFEPVLTLGYDVDLAGVFEQVGKLVAGELLVVDNDRR